MRAVGHNTQAAIYAGISPKRNIILATNPFLLTNKNFKVIYVTIPISKLIKGKAIRNVGSGKAIVALAKTIQNKIVPTKTIPSILNIKLSRTNSN